MSIGSPRRFRKHGLGALAAALPACLLVLAAVPAQAQADSTLTIEQLVADGWKVAGYAAQGVTFILFRHEDRKYLVQCSVIYDTTRGTKASERVKTNCYELH